MHDCDVIERDRPMELALYILLIAVVPMLVAIALYLIGGFTAGTSDTTQWTGESRWAAVIFGVLFTGIGYGIAFGVLDVNDTIVSRNKELNKAYREERENNKRLVSQVETLKDQLANSRPIDKLEV